MRRPQRHLFNFKYLWAAWLKVYTSVYTYCWFNTGPTEGFFGGNASWLKCQDIYISVLYSWHILYMKYIGFITYLVKQNRCKIHKL